MGGSWVHEELRKGDGYWGGGKGTVMRDIRQAAGVLKNVGH